MRPVQSLARASSSDDDVGATRSGYANDCCGGDGGCCFRHSGARASATQSASHRGDAESATESGTATTDGAGAATCAMASGTWSASGDSICGARSCAARPCRPTTCRRPLALPLRRRPSSHSHLRLLRRCCTSRRLPVQARRSCLRQSRACARTASATWTRHGAATTIPSSRGPWTPSATHRDGASAGSETQSATWTPNASASCDGDSTASRALRCGRGAIFGSRARGGRHGRAPDGASASGDCRSLDGATRGLSRVRARLSSGAPARRRSFCALATRASRHQRRCQRASSSPTRTRAASRGSPPRLRATACCRHCGCCWRAHCARRRTRDLSPCCSTRANASPAARATGGCCTLIYFTIDVV